MKLLLILILSGFTASAQFTASDTLTPLPAQLPSFSLTAPQPLKEKIRVKPIDKWKMTGNRWLTGALVFTAGASKGFNETLMFHWKAFRHSFPKANPNWFNPDVSWRNKYKGGDPNAGAKFPLSTSVLVAATDQYHLNNFINRVAWGTTVVIKIGEGKKPLKHYLLDFLYYSLCHQAGFALTYYPFKDYKGN
jgi:hypothetical protein